MTIFSLSLLLPIAFFILLALHGASTWRDEEAGRDWRYAFLVATVVWGVILALSTELLSPLNAVSRPGVALVWLLALAGLYWRSDGFRRIPAVPHRLRQEAAGLERWQRGLIVGLTGLFGLLFAVAWVSPPNNVDSLLYHMSRVMHWAQNESISHYPAVFHHQLNMPPWSEQAILHLRVLFGDDRPAALVQWFAMMGSLIGVSYCAKRLGAGIVGQALATVFAATLPMGILQATSTQNDYVVAFWLVASLAFSLDVFESQVSWHSDARLGAAAALGLLTKATFYIYGLPVVAGYLILRLRYSDLRRALQAGSLISLTVLALNLGYWARNMSTFSEPLGGVPSIRESLLGTLSYGAPGYQGRSRRSGDSVQRSEFEVLTVDPGSTSCCSLPIPNVQHAGLNPGPLDWFGDLARRSVPDLLLHLVTPSSVVNDVLETGLRNLPWLLSGDYFIERAAAAWNHEDTAGNPLHLTMIAIGAPILFLRIRTYPKRSRVYWHGAAVVAGFLLLTTFFREPRIYELRYHLAFFVGIAPVIGVAFEPVVSGWFRHLIPLGLLLALPWLLLNNMRPVVGMPPWPTRTESVFSISKQEILLAIAPHAVDDYSAAAQRITESQCRQVGLAIGQQDLEYAFWWLLDAPQSGVRMEVINPSPETARYADPEFEPCAVLCTHCGAAEDQLEAMNFEGAYDNFDLYLMDGGS